MIYIVIYLIIGLIALIEPNVKKEQRKILLYISASIIVLFQAFRWRTGTDWQPYYDFFNESKNFRNCLDSGFEIGYSFLNHCIRNLTDSYTVFLFIECLLNIIFVCLFARYFNKRYSITILLTTFAIGVFPIRYTLAASIIAVSYKYIIEKNFIKFLILNLFAVSIHRSAIIFIPLYFIVRKNYTLKFIIFLYLASIIIGLLTNITLNYIVKISIGLYDFLSIAFQNKLNAYVSDEVPDYAQMTAFRWVLSIVNSSIFIILFYIYKKKYFQSNKLYNIVFNLYFFGICFNRVFLLIIPDFARLTSLFSAGFIVMVIMIITNLKIKNKYVFLIFVLFYFFLKYWSTINGYYSDLFLPYYSVFSESQRVVVY